MTAAYFSATWRRRESTAGIAARAGQLKELLDRTFPGERVHLIGHSMGGLDARYMISCLDMAQRVLTLTVQALAQKSQVERTADRMARWFLPAVLGLAALTFLVGRLLCVGEKFDGSRRIRELVLALQQAEGPGAAREDVHAAVIHALEHALDLARAAHRLELLIG